MRKNEESLRKLSKQEAMAVENRGFHGFIFKTKARKG